jgi:opacity protein-like surface antigen
MPLRSRHVVLALLSCLAFGQAGLVQAAAEPRYTFAEIGYVNADYDDIDDDGDGFLVGGSYALTRNVHAVADYSDLDLDGNADASIWSVGAGVNYALRPGLDAVGRLRYIDAEVDQPGDDSDSGYGLEAGLRTMINPQLELNGAIRYVDVFDDNTSLVLGGLYEIANNVALGGELEFSDDYTALLLRARLYFNPPRQLR